MRCLLALCEPAHRQHDLLHHAFVIAEKNLISVQLVRNGLESSSKLGKNRLY